MRPPPPLSLPRSKSRAGRGFGGSLAFHLLLLFLVLWAHDRGVSIFSAEPTAGDPFLESGGGGGGGGRVMEYIALAQPPKSQPQVVPTPVPPPVIPPPDPEIVPPTTDPLVEVVASPIPTAAALTPGGGGSGSGGGTGSGTGTGNGAGEGPGSGDGSGGGGGGGRARPPEPRQLILPPLDFPKVMRGRTVAVTFWVGADGRVVRVELAPEIPDRGFSKKFEDVMLAYRFRPARSAEGAAIPGITTVSVTF